MNLSALFRAIRDLELTATKVGVLLCVESGETCPSAISRKISISSAAMTGAGDSLVRWEFLARVEHSEDRRLRGFALTEKGREALKAIREALTLP